MDESEPSATIKPAKKTSVRPKWLVLTGAAISRIGHVSVPLGVGLAVGFYLADRGTRWLPTTLEIVLAILLLGFVSIVGGRVAQGGAYVDTPDNKRIRKRIFFFGSLAIAASVIRLVLFWVETPSPLTELQNEDFNETFELDQQRYVALDKQLDNAIFFLEENLSEKGVLTASEEKLLLDVWRTIYDSSFALDQIRIFYEDWYRFDPSRAQRSYHLRSFLLTFAAELALYDNSDRAQKVIGRNPNAAKFLDAPHPAHGLPAGTYSFLKQELLGGKDLARVAAGEQYLRFLETGFNARSEAGQVGATYLLENVEQHIAALRRLDTFKKAAMGISSDYQPIKRQLRRNWYPTQTAIARWMGDTRFKRVGKYLISKKQREEADKHFEPGDILLARKNWYLSNVGLPGFWPHAILYLGDHKKFEAYFDDESVRALVTEISGTNQSLSTYLARTWPRKWALYSQGHGDEPNRVIEAISEGVVFNTLGHTAGDYLAALRPRLDKRAKAQAIVEAFSHHGKPYDFEFDFATDHALVCTELVWRSYRPGPNKKGLTIPTTSLMGRQTLPANDIADLYTREKESGASQLDFIYFIDAFEKEKKAVVSTEEQFAKTSSRTKWDGRLP